MLVSLSSHALLLHSLCIAAEPLHDVTESEQPVMPQRGICAHRGASVTHPENTLAALREAVRLGAHMVEFDLALTKDSQVVLMHDKTVERTTDGHGRVADLTLAELRKLDAGSWKSPRFQNEKIPTLAEALDVLPLNIWINIHLKGEAKLAAETARHVDDAKRLHQAVLACGSAAAKAAREVEPNIKICNMDRQLNNREYVNATIDQSAEFIQFLSLRSPDADQIKRLKQQKIRVNYCCTDDAEALQQLFSIGVDFILVDDLATMLQAAERQGIDRLKPVFR